MSELSDRHIQKIITESLSLTKDGVGVYDGDDKLVFCNNIMGGLFGLTAKEALNQTFTNLCLACFNDPIGINIESSSFDSWLSNALIKRRNCQFRTFETDTHDGRWFLVTEQVVQGSFLYVYFTDITEKKENELALKDMSDRLKEIVDKDYLTGIHNRRYFYQKAKAEFNRSKRANQDLSLLIFDLDNFKRINDNYGHAVGDVVLQEFSSNVRSFLRGYDIFARIGGEEFALLLPATKANEAYVIAERIRQLIASLTIPFEKGTVKVTTSIGLIESLDNIGEFEQMMRFADKNLYQAKLNGRNQTFWCKQHIG
ncbi:MAG: diguanylate cyclase [Photobacterium frigidiphilum]|uniref:sensor domain-containing diguanylate cyclase n=1 Tax=Photobacterium frigidiphilum TaxID=264736 RepID=UPI00300332F1